MKKVVSLILVVALFAGLAVFASADGVAVVHEQSSDPMNLEIQQQIEHGDGYCAWLNTFHVFVPASGKTPGHWVSGADVAASAVAASSQQVKISNAPEDMELTWTKCAEAITVKEMKAIIDADEEDAIKNLTVFYQRNVQTAGGDMDVRLWPCNPERKRNQSVVVLYRPDGGEWDVLGVSSDDKDVTVTLPAGCGAFAVCMAW